MGLWAQGISGDLPILLLRIDAAEDIAIARQLLQAHEYWQMKGFAVDLVILRRAGGILCSRLAKRTRDARFA